MGNKKKWGISPYVSNLYTLEMRHVFTVASFSRTTTPVVLTELEYDGIVGYGEAACLLT
ncbi:hypothetical protein [Sphingobacterium sp. T2]|uniref:hypothetical protein n=1 Tax=Sphingobacterium sp. T2 TaxID=1590596 RepID=UPI0029342782|nr:hypothetical protein [Sphingobacterium sp. T2]